MSDIMLCPICKDALVSTTEPLKYPLGQAKIVLRDLDRSMCRSCDFEEFDTPPLVELDREIATLLAMKPERLGPEEVRVVRRHIGRALASDDSEPTAAKTAAMLRVTPQSLSRWENGKAAMGELPEMMLRLLALDGRGQAHWVMQYAGRCDYRPRTIVAKVEEGGWKVQFEEAELVRDLVVGNAQLQRLVPMFKEWNGAVLGVFPVVGQASASFAVAQESAHRAQREKKRVLELGGASHLLYRKEGETLEHLLDDAHIAYLHERHR